jgi:hypothetical protein
VLMAGAPYRVAHAGTDRLQLWGVQRLGAEVKTRTLKTAGCGTPTNLCGTQELRRGHPPKMRFLGVRNRFTTYP